MERRVDPDTVDGRTDEKMNRGDSRRGSKYCETTYCPHTHTHTCPAVTSLCFPPVNIISRLLVSWQQIS